MLTLALGDLYIPDRSIDIPEKFRKLLSPNPNSIPSNNKISQVLCLGNITSSLETLQFLHNISPSLHLVRGEFDDANILSQFLNQLSEEKVNDIPNYKIIIHDNLKIGFTNGYLVIPKNDPLSLLALARELDVDILIWGGTHKVEAYILDGKFFINPGSATGAFSFDWPNDDETSDEEEPEKEEVEDEKTEEPEKQEPEKEEQEKTEEVEEKSDKQVEQVKEPEEQITAEDITDAKETTSNIPSFCLLETYDSTCTLYIYTYLNQEVKVDKVTYHKDS